MSTETTNMRTVAIRKSPRQKRSQEKVERILDEARLILTEQGLEQLTTNHIARRSGMSIGSIYQYFPNKQSILNELYLRWLKGVRDVVVGFDTDETNGRNFYEVAAELLPAIFQAELHSELDSRFQDELKKGMALYPELTEIEQEHGDIIVSTLSSLLYRVGVHIDDETRHHLAYFLYMQSDCLEAMLIDTNCSPEQAFTWFNQAIHGVMQNYLPDHDE
ncbi:TetR/AcrR family transcriptional regulator [Parendozoicomonas haliclonae]|uniref:DNA-binding transcriptional repressor AcrR n=1 Tax=Parendozoicomonas haliclonae TaxID=1960125 RepID=A0A1X7AJN7_9GAMM|nr:TetR/AcrR family transcriptional regulator [Parendozoicomonas haliclonae]SMA47029.1 DNA-binding transcriptional repressor AcrR [Parendozoicomonas haliclonae]